MANVIKERRQALIKESIEKNPECQLRKKLIFYLLSAAVVSRIIYSILQIAFCIVNGIPLEPFATIIVVVTIFMAYGYCFLIYSAGLKQLAYLTIFGGLYSLYKAYSDNVFLYLGTTNILFNIVNIFFIIAILIQILVMVFLSIDKKCNVYFSTMAEIQKDMTNWQKNN